MMHGLSHATLTGQKRYRVYKPMFGPQLVVLQVQWKGIRSELVGGHVDSEWVTVWHDARPEDITFMGAY